MFSFLKKTILVVEDSEPLVKAISLKLRENNFIVLSARSYGQAVTLLERERRLRAIWLDHYLIGDRSGLDVLEYVRTISKLHKHVPVFVVSAMDDHAIIERYRRLGVAEFYLKAEYELSTIIDDISRAIARTQPQKEGSVHERA